MSTPIVQPQAKADSPFEVARRNVEEVFTEGEKSLGVAPRPRDDARRLATAALAAILVAKMDVVWSFMKKARLEAQLRPDISATVEFSGPVSKTDIERLKKHLDLMAEGLPETL